MRSSQPPKKEDEDEPSIADLPIEVLELIFNHLSAVDRRAARQVCRAWRRILWANRYLTTATLLINPHTLVDHHTLEQIKPWAFRNLSISTFALQGDPEDRLFYIRARLLLKSALLLESLNTIALETNGKDLHFMLDNRVTTSYPFENVTELVLIAKPEDNPQERFVPLNVDVQMPKLTTLRLDAITRANYQFLQMFHKQLRSLVIKLQRKHELLLVLSLTDWDNLRELAIGIRKSERHYHEILSLEDLYLNHVATLQQLEQLQIKDEANMLARVYEIIVSSAPNLTHLRLTAIEMSTNVLDAANSLQNLQLLQLLGRSSNPNWASEIEFHLPDLHTLHLSPELMARPGYLPKLHTLAIVNHTSEPFHWRRMWGLNALERFARLPTIRKVYMRGVSMTCVDGFVLSLFNEHCTVLSQDRHDRTIGQIRIPPGECLQQFRVQLDGDVERLDAFYQRPRSAPIRQPRPKPCVGQLCRLRAEAANRRRDRGCLSLESSSSSSLSTAEGPPPLARPNTVRRRMRTFRKRVQRGLVVAVRRLRRAMFVLGTAGCCCLCW